MTSKEIVKRSVEFRSPGRMARATRFFGESDFHHIGLKTPAFTPRKPGYYEWGYTMAHSEIPNNGMPADVPIKSWDDLASYKWPDPRNPERYELIRRQLAEAAARVKYVHLGWFVGLFDLVYRLREFEDCMRDFVFEPAKMKYLIAGVADFMLGVIDELASRFPGQIDGLLVPDDWGSQSTTFMSIPMWEEFFGSHYRAIGDRLHKAGIHFWLHSDGRINDLMPVLIDCGLDVINLPSPLAVGIDEIAERFAGKIAFINGVDLQKTMNFGSDEEIEAQAKELIEKWNTAKGGFIPSEGLGYVAGGVSKERSLVAINAFRRYGWGLPPLSMEEAERLKG